MCPYIRGMKWAGDIVLSSRQIKLVGLEALLSAHQVLMRHQKRCKIHSLSRLSRLRRGLLLRSPETDVLQHPGSSVPQVLQPFRQLRFPPM